MSAEAIAPITTYFRVCDGVRVRFADNGADSDVTVLLLAPWPESLWAFRHIWDRVSAVARTVAIDMPGFGHSDGRPELIAPDASGAFLARLIDEWGLEAPHVVGPDVGTAAALFLAAKAPQNSLTVGGRRSPLPIEAGGALKDIIEAPSLDVVRGLDAGPASATPSRPCRERERARGPRGLCQRLRPRSLRGVGPVRAALPRAEPGVARTAADDHHPDPDRGGARR